MDTLPTNVICQIGLVVREVATTARAYAETFGLPVPPVRMTGPQAETQTRYRGQPTSGRPRLALFHMGALSLELIEPVDGPSTWRESLDAHGEGVQHIPFRIQGMAETVDFLESSPGSRRR